MSNREDFAAHLGLIVPNIMGDAVSTYKIWAGTKLGIEKIFETTNLAIRNILSAYDETHAEESNMKLFLGPKERASYAKEFGNDSMENLTVESVRVPYVLSPDSKLYLEMAKHLDVYGMKCRAIFYDDESRCDCGLADLRNYFV